MKTNDLGAQVSRMADEGYEMARALTGAQLDFSPASLQLVDGLLVAYAAQLESFDNLQRLQIVQRFGSYFLEVARRQFGGVYKWYKDQPQPALVVGEPTFHLSILGWDRTAAALAGQKDNDLVRYYIAVGERIRTATPGTEAIYR